MSCTPHLSMTFLSSNRATPSRRLIPADPTPVSHQLAVLGAPQRVTKGNPVVLGDDVVDIDKEVRERHTHHQYAPRVALNSQLLPELGLCSW